LNKLITEKGRKFELSAQGQDLAPFNGNGTKVKIPSEIKLPFTKSNQLRLAHIFILKRNLSSFEECIHFFILAYCRKSFMPLNPMPLCFSVVRTAFQMTPLAVSI
jgi:hypothetical protein